MTKTRNILGLHFGHDGAACVLRNGEIAGYVLRERSNRVKHALGLIPVTAPDTSANDHDRVANSGTLVFMPFTTVEEAWTKEQAKKQALGEPARSGMDDLQE